MKKPFILLALIGLLFTTSCNTQAKEITPKSGNQSLLWEISGNGLDKPSYLFGTIHLIPKKEFFIPTGTKDALEAAEQLVLEIDIDIPLKEQIAMVSKMMIPDGKSLQDFVSEEEFAAFKQYLIDTIGMKEKKVGNTFKMKPILTSGVYLKKAVGKITAYEKYFAAQAKKQNMSFIPLETLDFQLGLMDSISIEDQAEAMVKSDLLGEYYEMLNIYKTQDLNNLYKLLDEEEGVDADFEKHFLEMRNKNWIDKLQNEILREKSSFIAVGALHLPGENGVINLLKEAGYTVTPVTE